MTQKAFQDHYPDALSYCHGCGRLNEHGLHVKSRWDGDESVAFFVPEPYHMAIPGYVYGGLIASLIDCHSTGTAMAAKYRAQGRAMDTDPPWRFVTASLHVDYLRPTPIDAPMELRGRVVGKKKGKTIVEVTLYSKDKLCVRGEVVAAQLPKRMRADRGGDSRPNK